MLMSVASQFVGTPVLVVADSWFGNDGLYRPLSQSEFEFHILSRLRCNIILYGLPPINGEPPASMAQGSEALRTWPPRFVKRHEPSRFFYTANSAKCSPMIESSC